CSFCCSALRQPPGFTLFPYTTLFRSWISLLAQSGIIGTVIAAVWIAGVVFRAMKTAKARTLYLPLLAFILVRSFMENGLIDAGRSEEHTSELQSRENLVCRLLLEKKN